MDRWLAIEEVDSAPITTRALDSLASINTVSIHGDATTPRSRAPLKFSNLFNKENTAFNRTPLPHLNWANANDVWEVSEHLWCHTTQWTNYMLCQLFICMYTYVWHLDPAMERILVKCVANCQAGLSGSSSGLLLQRLQVQVQIQATHLFGLLLWACSRSEPNRGASWRCFYNKHNILND